MKYQGILFFIFTLLSACNQSGHEHDNAQASEAIKGDDNAALLAEVMKIHDEGMEKMDAMMRRKKELETQLGNATADQKAAFEKAIAKLDSADSEMMDWMHHFTMEQDSLNDEDYREYLEAELIKIKKVREDIVEALKGANE